MTGGACRDAPPARRGPWLPGLGVILAFLTATDAPGQDVRPGHAQGGKGLSATVNVVTAFQSGANLEGGSEFSVSRTLFLLDLSKRIDETRDLGLSFFFDHEDFDFQGATGFGGAAPWNAVERLGLGVPFVQRLPDGWRITVTPSAEFSRETGAGWSDALEYGGIVSAGKRVSETLTLGIGAGVFARLEEVSAFPYVVVNWKISDRLRLTNPLRAGPTGPAGLELVGSVAEGWDLGVGGAYRSVRFRLDDEGVAPGGIGEVRAVPAWLRLSHRIGPAVLDGYAGAVFGGKLALEDDRGGPLGAEGYDPAPFAALRVQARF